MKFRSMCLVVLSICVPGIYADVVPLYPGTAGAVGQTQTSAATPNIQMDVKEFVITPFNVSPEPSYSGIIALILGIGACRFFWVRRGREKSLANIPVDRDRG